MGLSPVAIDSVPNGVIEGRGIDHREEIVEVSSQIIMFRSSNLYRHTLSFPSEPDLYI